MRSAVLTLAAVAIAAPAAGAATGGECGAINLLVKDARSDFAGLAKRQLAPAKCRWRAKEYRCDWAFPGDAFAPAEGAATQMTRCLAAHPWSVPAAAKRGTSAFVIDQVLQVSVTAPSIEDGSWTIRLRIEPITQ